MSCEGPEGPAGVDGVDGADGADGVNANAFCLDCHATDKWAAINTAFTAHKHASGTSWSYAGSRGYCGHCHSSDSYDQYTSLGEIITSTGTPLVCSTCHTDHGSLEEADIEAPVRMIDAVASEAVSGAEYDHGAGNLCATCHQARRTASDEYVATDATYTRTFTGDDIDTYSNAAVGPNGSITTYGTDSIVVVFDVPANYEYISSTHLGPHHGPQANMFAADMGSVTGTAFSKHTDCSWCHLNDTTATTGYGHNFKPDIGQCDACHGTAVDIEADQAAIATRLAAAQTALEGIHAIHVDGDGVPHPVYASLPKDEFDAFWNFMCVYEDMSLGVHNPGYADQLLDQVESALGL